MITRDETITLAKQCAQGHPISMHLFNELTMRAWSGFFERFAQAVYNKAIEAKEHGNPSNDFSLGSS